MNTVYYIHTKIILTNINVFALSVAFFFLNLGAIMALETAAVCVCVHVCFLWCFIKGIQTFSVCQKRIQVFRFLTDIRSVTQLDLFDDLMSCVFLRVWVHLCMPAL